jgi:Uncharacterised nucleotidyltransferase
MTRSGSRRRGGSLPTASQVLLLRAALGEREEALQAWHEWTVEGDLEEVERVDPGSRSLLPLVWRNLSAVAPEEELPERLRSSYQETWAHNQFLASRGSEVIRTLQGAGLDALVLKGAALSALHYRDWGVRPMEDVDVMVPTGKVSMAHEALREAGWNPASSDFERLIPVRHGETFHGSDGGVFDLHWHALRWPAREDDFWEAAVPLEIGGVRALGLAPADQLLHVCVHAATPHPWPQVRWIADVMTVLGSAGGELDWRRVIEQTRLRDVSVSMAVSLGFLADTFPGSVPAEVLREVRAIRAGLSERLGYWATTLAPPHPARTFFFHWDQYRRARKIGFDGHGPMGFIGFVLRWREVGRIWDLPGHLRGRLALYRRR